MSISPKKQKIQERWGATGKFRPKNLRTNCRLSGLQKIPKELEILRKSHLDWQWHILWQLMEYALELGPVHSKTPDLIHQARSEKFAVSTLYWKLMCRHHLIASPTATATASASASHRIRIPSASHRTNPFRDDLTAAVFLNFAVPSIKADRMLYAVRCMLAFWMRDIQLYLLYIFWFPLVVLISHPAIHSAKSSQVERLISNSCPNSYRKSSVSPARSVLSQVQWSINDD